MRGSFESQKKSRRQLGSKQKKNKQVRKGRSRSYLREMPLSKRWGRMEGLRTGLI